MASAWTVLGNSDGVGFRTEGLQASNPLEFLVVIIEQANGVLVMYVDVNLRKFLILHPQLSRNPGSPPSLACMKPFLYHTASSKTGTLL